MKSGIELAERGFNGGHEWWMAHYRFSKKPVMTRSATEHTALALAEMEA